MTKVPGFDHGWVVDQITQMFCDYRRDRPGLIRYRAGGGECRLRLRGMATDRHPDQAVYLDPKPAITSRLWEQWIPSVVVEVVSEGGEDRDYIQKAEEYLVAGVQEYWILDPSDRTFHVHQRINDAWVVTILGDDATYQTPLLPGLDVHPGDLLGPAS